MRGGLFMAMGQLIKRAPKQIESSLAPLFTLLSGALSATETDSNVLSAVQGINFFSFKF